MEIDQEKKLVIGIGAESRGDDAVGLLVARRLRGKTPAGVTIREATGHIAAFIEDWDRASAVFLVDAARSGSAPGTLHRIDVAEKALPSKGLRWSTHGAGIGEAVELARALGRLPRRLTIYGIEGKSFEAGKPLSMEAERGARLAVDAILQELTRDERGRCTGGV
ncbi:MAG TPA: hydrogenase maturation protease [Candidatus Acidoferrales bacterium]|nr:hydrogenase maturation protease [Candidatus Acidoferrales bacterium]